MTWEIVRDDDRITVAGELRISDGKAIWESLIAATKRPAPRIDLDVSRTTALDGTMMGLLVQARNDLHARGIRCEIVGATGAVASLVELYGGTEPAPAPRTRTPRHNLIERLGAATARVAGRSREPAVFFGDVLAAIPTMLQRPARTSWRALPLLVARAGADGMPIVVLLNFLVGFLFVFQSTPLLEMYGANIWAADLIGIAGTRELAPLITAVIISGRSGASFAAQLGTMRVSEEIDALRTLGISPVQYLVLPRIVTLAIAAPLLTIVADVAMLAGGFIVGVSDLGVTPRGYMAELRLSVLPWDVWSGVVKSSVFGITIATIGCRRGLATRGAAAGVGRSTTETVVRCLFAIVILDVLMTMMFRGVGVVR
jgi:phospholipid/cholesterol/gamma-HCH transport system permease protein